MNPFVICDSNTPLFVIMDKSSALTILDLSQAHSFFHPIDPKNGLNLSPLLPLCYFTLAFVVGEGEILVFFMLTVQVSLLIWHSTDFYVKNVIFNSRLY